MSNSEYIAVHLDYANHADPDTPFVVCPAVPRTGEVIITASGRQYRVLELTFDSHESPLRLVARVKWIGDRQSENYDGRTESDASTIKVHQVKNGKGHQKSVITKG